MNRIQLTKCEAEVMNIVWRRKVATVQDVVNSLDRELAYTTVMTTMKILENKNVLLRDRKVGRAYIYRAAVSREEVRRDMVWELTERIFGGSPQSLMLSLLHSNKMSAADIELLRQAVADLESVE